MSNISNNRDVLPFSQLRNYQIQTILGNGNFGITYLAEETSPNTQVAIKEYFPNAFVMRDGDNAIQTKSEKDADNFAWGLNHFLYEAQMLAQFNHPNIVRVLEFFQANNTAYLVMEYEPGQNLANFLKEKKGEIALIDEVMKLFPPFLEGLETLHTNRYLHQDIQPANIYLRQKDQSPVLIDFGVARYQLANHTHSLNTIITPGFTAFEQYQSDGQKGAWTDIYSASAVLYWLISGQIPAKAMERATIIGQNLPDPLIPAVEIAYEKYPQHFLKAIDWGLAINQQERPQNVKAWRDKLFIKSVSKKDKPSTQTKKVHSMSKNSGSDHKNPRQSSKFQGLALSLVVIFLIVLLGGGGWLLYREFGKSSQTPEINKVSPEFVPTVDTTSHDSVTITTTSSPVDFYDETTDTVAPPMNQVSETAAIVPPVSGETGIDNETTIELPVEFEPEEEDEVVVTEAEIASRERETRLQIAAQEKAAAVQSQLPSEPLRIMTGAGVRLRQKPRQNAKKGVILQIGTIVSELDETRRGQKVWHQVTTVNGDKGWVSSKYTLSFKPEGLAQAFIEVANQKLDNHRASFGDLVDLCNFLNEAHEKVELDGAVELKLLYLKVLQRSLDKIPADQKNEPRYLKWVNLHKADIVYQTSRGWVIKKERFQQLHDEYNFLSIADRILEEAP
jgi:serine/threonine protein kinase